MTEQQQFTNRQEAREHAEAEFKKAHPEPEPPEPEPLGRPKIIQLERDGSLWLQVEQSAHANPRLTICQSNSGSSSRWHISYEESQELQRELADAILNYELAVDNHEKQQNYNRETRQWNDDLHDAKRRAEYQWMQHKGDASNDAGDILFEDDWDDEDDDDE